ncbi:MAG: FAD-dependent oxidoreductase [Alphaproteobacteria bacterium]|nr:FAD-dependent oxidoreductase [Alphaproteobacteria bacterium]
MKALLTPFQLKHLTLRNRVISTAHAPALAEAGMPGERYQLYHAEKAKGGIALTMFGGSASVAHDSPATDFAQVSLADDAVIPFLKQFSDRVHAHGAALMTQITHMGRRNRWDTADWLPLIAPSPIREPQHRAMAKEIEDFDIARVIAAFAAAARRCRDGGLDGLEVFLGGGHLINQFLSPAMNRRIDKYGGNLDNRLRFAFEVLEAVRKAVGGAYIVGVRYSADELLAGGLDQKEMLEVARRLAKSGLIDFLDVNHGHPIDHAGMATIIPGMPFGSAPFLYLASAVKAEIDLPVFHAGRINDLATAARAIAEGHVDMVGMTRAHIADPHIVKKLMEGRPDDIRQCVGANYCVDRIFLGGEALCLQNPATTREQTMPHVIPRAAARRRVVVAGAGPAGLEAARVSAERGHEVILFERAPHTGGQIAIAAKATWRENLSGIARWLDGQVRRLPVDVRLGAPATAEGIAALAPDVVIVATGGRPNRGRMQGVDHAVSTWDILTGAVPPGENVLVYDENGQHQGASVAEVLAARGATVELVTPDRMAAEQMGGANFAQHMKELYRLNVLITPNQRLTQIYEEGNQLVAVLKNIYTGAEEERTVDQIVAEHGTLPEDGLYFALKPGSSNHGEVDYEALVAGRPQGIVSNPTGRYQLFRVGDAIASRNIHAALYDSLRLCKEL